MSNPFLSKKTWCLIVIMFILMALSVCYFFIKTQKEEPATQSMDNHISNFLKKSRILLKENQYYAKGGVGIIREGYYVTTRGKGNSIILPNGSEWESHETYKNECVFVYKETVYDKNLPDDFSLWESILVTFSEDRIFFIDFLDLSGGYYLRD